MSQTFIDNKPSLLARITIVLLRWFVARSMMDMSDPSLLIALRDKIARWDYLSNLFAFFSRRQYQWHEVNFESVSARNITPAISKTPQLANTVLLYLHGGGFFFRSLNGHTKLCAKICRDSGITRAVLPLYHLAPEHPYPAAINDAISVYRQLLEQGTTAENIVFGGDSAGGCLVLSTLLACRDQGLPMPAAAVLMSPVTDLSNSGESTELNRLHDPMFGSVPMTSMDYYLGDTPCTDPNASPFHADFTGFPPILAQVGSTERLLDDSVRLQKNAERAASQLHVQIWNQMPHVWQTLGLPESKQAISHIANFLKTQLKSNKSQLSNGN